MTCWKKDCKTCKKEGGWEYIFGVTFKEWFDMVRWADLLFIVVLGGFLTLALGWWGLILSVFILYGLGVMEGGLVFDINNDYPKEVYPPNKCSANIKDCKICDNEYSHEFNVVYEKEHRWYNI